jgi:hypothetical protein
VSVHEIPNSTTGFIDRTGNRCGRWTILSYAGARKWLCRCDCGKEKMVNATSLNGRSQSCGCLRDDVVRGLSPYPAGTTKTRVYRIWKNMKTRCFNVNRKEYKDYGGRGIAVCPRWRDSFDNFLADMGEPPTRQHSIDRINNDGDYEPSNCRWATAKEQARNKRSNRIFTLQGETLTLTEWCQRFKTSMPLVHQRIHRRGWDVLRALTTPSRRTGR